MKYVVVILQGAADHPLEILDGRTPLEAAVTPVLDRLAAAGRVGRASFLPETYDPDSELAWLNLLGHDARRHARIGRANLEARDLRLFPHPGEHVLCARLLSTADGRVDDLLSDTLQPAEAICLADAVNESVAALSARLIWQPTGAGGSRVWARGWATVRFEGEFDPETTAPGHLLGERLERHLPSGPGADRLREILHVAADVLREHEVNRQRAEAGLPPADALWLWGAGKTPRLPRFRATWGLGGLCVSLCPMVRGLAAASGLTVRPRAEAAPTQPAEGDLVAEGLAAPSEAEVIFIHLGHVDLAAHTGRAAAKIAAIEQADAALAPLVSELQRCETWRVLVTPLHVTAVGSRKHEHGSVPVLLAGPGVPCDGAERMTEAAANAGALLIDPPHRLLEYFLKR